MDLLLQLDPIRNEDPMIRDGKRSISRELVQFLESIEGIVVKKQGYFVKTTKNPRFVHTHTIKKSRVLDSKNGNLSDDQRKLLQNLKDRVEKIIKVRELSSNDKDATDDDDGDHIVLISRRNGASQNKKGVFVQRQVVQPKVKKNVNFADDENISKVHSDTYEPVLNGNTTYLDGRSSSEDHGETLENLDSELEHYINSSQGVEDDEEIVVENGGSPQSSDGERNSRRDLKNHAQHQKVIFSAPLPLKMEPRTDLMKNKGVRIVTDIQ